MAWLRPGKGRPMLRVVLLHYNAVRIMVHF